MLDLRPRSSPDSARHGADPCTVHSPQLGDVIVDPNTNEGEAVFGEEDEGQVLRRIGPRGARIWSSVRLVADLHVTVRHHSVELQWRRESPAGTSPSADSHLRPCRLHPELSTWTRSPNLDLPTSGAPAAKAMLADTGTPTPTLPNLKRGEEDREQEDSNDFESMQS